MKMHKKFKSMHSFTSPVGRMRLDSGPWALCFETCFRAFMVKLLYFHCNSDTLEQGRRMGEKQKSGKR